MKESAMIELLRLRGYAVHPAKKQDPAKMFIINVGGEGKRYTTRRNRLTKGAVFDWPKGTVIAEVDFTVLKWDPI